MRFFFVSFALLLSCLISAQSSHLYRGNPANHIHDRLEITSGIDSPIHSSVQFYSRKDLVQYAQRILDSGVELSDKDLYDLKYILDDNNEFSLEGEDNYQSDVEYKKNYRDSSLFYTIESQEKVESKSTSFEKTTRKPVLSHFFKTPANFFEIDADAFSLKINPVVNVKFGKDLEDNDNIIFQNTRGIELRGLIDEKVYFYTNLYETQGQFNDFVNERIALYDAIPGFGSYKDFNSSVSDKFNGFDFPNSQAYFGVNVSKHVGIELGHNRHFIGNGYHSLLLSDYANNYFYLKFSTKIWKFHYQNIFAELTPVSNGANTNDELLPKKYMANHYLSFKPRPNIEIGLFETVVFSRENQFEFQYLNPVILYRTVEFSLGSPDNVLIGLNGKWNFLKQFSLYGQVILDEFKLSEITGGTGWWANKYGAQLGLKYFNAFNIDHLDLQGEFNVVRPYTYGQSRELEDFPTLTVSNYSHFFQPLAHPLGANFKEFVGLLNYKVSNRLSLKGRLLIAQYGDSVDGQHWGNDILVSSDLKPQDFNNEIGQGVDTKVTQLGLDVSYEFFHNYFFDFHALLRNKDSALDQFDLKTSYFGAGIRANVGNLRIDY